MATDSLPPGPVFFFSYSECYVLSKCHSGLNPIPVQARIKAGRDVDNKKQLGEVILKGLDALSIPASVITVEIIAMEPESYGKYAPG